MGWLIDASAVAWLERSPDADEWRNRIGRGLVRITPVTLLELGYSARSAAEHRYNLEEPPLSLMLEENLTPPMEDRAIAVQETLAEHGRHRAPSPADLLVAAAAEISRLTVLHVDKDYELIADVTEQPTERLKVA